MLLVLYASKYEKKNRCDRLLRTTLNYDAFSKSWKQYCENILVQYIGSKDHTKEHFTLCEQYLKLRINKLDRM